MVFVGVGWGEGGGKVGVDCEGHLEMHTDIHNTDFSTLSSVIFLMFGIVWLCCQLLAMHITGPLLVKDKECL